MQLNRDSPQLSRSEQEKLVNDLGKSCQTVYQVDWTKATIKWGGGAPWVTPAPTRPPVPLFSEERPKRKEGPEE